MSRFDGDARAARFAALVCGLAGVTIILGLGQTLVAGIPSREASAVIGVFFVAMVVGEILRVGGVGPRGISPMAVAGALGLCFAADLPGGLSLQIGPGVVVIVAAAAIVVGLLITSRGALDDLARQAPTIAPAYAVRVVMIGTVVVAFRSLEIFDGRTAAEKSEDWQDDRWKLAIAMLAAALVGHVLEIALHVALRSAQEARDWRAILGEDVAEMIPGALAALSLIHI